MAFTEAQLNAAIDPGATGRVIDLYAYIPGAVNTTVFAQGIVAPYAGKARFVDIPNSQTAAQAFATIQAALK
jgi:hypothetical protein